MFYIDWFLLSGNNLNKSLSKFITKTFILSLYFLLEYRFFNSSDVDSVRVSL